MNTTKESHTNGLLSIQIDKYEKEGANHCVKELVVPKQIGPICSPRTLQDKNSHRTLITSNWNTSLFEDKAQIEKLNTTTGGNAGRRPAWKIFLFDSISQNYSLVILNSSESKKECGESSKKESSWIESGCEGIAPPLADLAEVVGRRDVLEESWNYRETM